MHAFNRSKPKLGITELAAALLIRKFECSTKVKRVAVIISQIIDTQWPRFTVNEPAYAFTSFTLCILKKSAHENIMYGPRVLKVAVL